MTMDGSMVISTLMDQATTNALRFLDLPAEIRLAIYSHLFEAAKLSCGTPHVSWPACDFAICSCLFPYHIVRTCRQLRDETLPLLMAATTVEVAGSLEKVVNMPEFYVGSISKAVVLDAKQFSLRPFQLEKLPALRILELRNITVWCMFYDEVFLQSPQADEAMYDMTMFNVKRMSATLHDLCRSSRSFKIHLCAQFVMSSLSDETIVSTSRVS